MYLSPLPSLAKTDPGRSEPFAPAQSNWIANPEIIRETLRSIDHPAFEAFVLSSQTGQEPRPPQQIQVPGRRNRGSGTNQLLMN
jgi:hypothetical protein